MKKLSALQIAKLTGKSKTTILNYYNKGDLSGERQKDKSVLFEISEVLRYFPKITREDIENLLNSKPTSSVKDEHLLVDNMMLKKENEFLLKEIETLKNNLNKSESDKQEIKEEKKKLLDMLERKDLLLEDMRLKTEIKPVEKRKKIFGIF